MLFAVRPFGFRAAGFCGVATARRTAGLSRARGSIGVENRDGDGPTFRVRLPPAQPGMV